MTNPESEREIELNRAILTINFRVLGIVFGLLLGGTIFLATNWLIIKGGEIGPDGTVVVGPHLNLLGQFLIGYSVTFWGSIIGFLYGFALGTLAGAVLATLYNLLTRLRQNRKIFKNY